MARAGYDISRLSAIVGGIYDAALDPASWTDALREVRDFVGGSSAGIVVKDTAANRGTLCYDTGTIEPAWTALYFDRYVTLDPWTAGHLFSTAESPVTTADLLPDDTFRETRFYKEWSEPQGFIDCIGAALDKSSTTATIFNVMRREEDGMFDEPGRRRVRLIAPHVRRAMAVGSAMDYRTAVAASLADVLDGLSAGVFLTGDNAEIVHANAAGREMLAEADFLLSSGGRLTARRAETNHALKGTIGAAAGGDVALGGRGVALPLAARGGDHYVAHMLPLTSGARRKTGRSQAATAAIFVRKATLDVISPSEMIARHYGLTPMEARILLAIVDIGGVPEVADSFGIAESTVKTHLGRLYGKTGTGRQADLVKIVAGFSSPLAA